MPIGPTVRRLFGRHEHRVAGVYRSLFVDLDAYGRQIGAMIPQANRILEVGCGEGAVTERLARHYPDADILAIDVSPNVGRLFQGCADNVMFMQQTVEAVAAKSPAAFDLVVLSDVIHHVPVDQRRELMFAVRRTVMPGGVLVFKDWERSPTPIHWLCHAGDRWLTGDRVSYLRKAEAVAILAEAFGRDRVASVALVPPWRNNFILTARG